MIDFIASVLCGVLGAAIYTVTSATVHHIRKNNRTRSFK